MNFFKKYEGYIILSGAVLMHMCFGTNYGWSIFANEFTKSPYNFSMIQCQSVFSVVQVCFTLSFVLGGRLHDRYGPRFVAILSSIIFSTGYFLAGLISPTPLSLILFVGIMGGGGAGIGYICPISTAQKWFPNKRSLVTGVSVLGYGIGAFFMAFVAEILLKSGIPVRNIFMIFGAIFLVICAGVSFLFKNPPNYIPEKTEKVSIKILVTSKHFWALFIPMCTGMFAGVMVISNLKPMGISWGMPEFIAAIGVSVLSLFNGLGRLIWGFIAHKIGEGKSIVISLTIPMITMFLSVFFVKEPILYFTFVSLAGLSYGACLVLYASTVTKIFGVERLGRIYSTLFLSNGVAGLLAPTFAGFIFDKTGNYSIALIMGSILCSIGILSFKLLYDKKFSINK